jgi:hypothetical protein
MAAGAATTESVANRGLTSFLRSSLIAAWFGDMADATIRKRADQNGLPWPDFSPWLRPSLIAAWFGDMADATIRARADQNGSPRPGFSPWLRSSLIAAWFGDMADATIRARADQNGSPRPGFSRRPRVKGLETGSRDLCPVLAARRGHGHAPLAATATAAVGMRLAGRQARTQKIAKEVHGPSPLQAVPQHRSGTGRIRLVEADTSRPGADAADRFDCCRRHPMQAGHGGATRVYVHGLEK